VSLQHDTIYGSRVREIVAAAPRAQPELVQVRELRRQTPLGTTKNRYRMHMPLSSLIRAVGKLVVGLCQCRFRIALNRA
jgi:hypothetical protein